MTGDSVVGRWSLVSWEMRPADGPPRFPLGSDARGTLIYGADGYMSVIFMAASRPKIGWSGQGTPVQAASEDIAAAFNSAIAYCGTYEVQGDKVIHHVELGTAPLHPGSDLVRPFAIKGSELHLSHVTPSGETGYLVFRRES
jgi:hypothetical protein